MKGEFATTYGSGESPFPPGLAVGTIVRSVDPSTATAEHALLRPVVDLDSLSIVKVLRYQPAGAPMIRRLRLGFVVIICVVLQTTLFTHLRIDGVAPEVGLVAVLAVAYYDGAESGRVVRFRDGALDRSVPHHPARALRACPTRSPHMGWGCSKRAWCAGRRRSRPLLGGIGGFFGGLVFLSIGAVVGESGFLSLVEPEDGGDRRASTTP